MAGNGKGLVEKMSFHLSLMLPKSKYLELDLFLLPHANFLFLAKSSMELPFLFSQGVIIISIIPFKIFVIVIMKFNYCI